MPVDFKRTGIRKNQMSVYKLAYDEKFTNFMFWLFVKKTLLSAFMENMHNGKKLRQIEHISAKNGLTCKKL